MRNLSSASLAKISQHLGTEPINIVKVEWLPGYNAYYSDRTIQDYPSIEQLILPVGVTFIESRIIEGRILELGNLNSTFRVDGAGSAETITLKLDDSDGVLKQIYNNNDIHKRRVVIYQWFEGIPIDEMFTLFEGEISSPIVWSEPERTLSFSLASKVEDREVGFSPEEGQFNDLPVDLIGKPWPLVFGTARYIPATPIQKTPTAILITPWGIPDPQIQEQIARLYAQYNAPREPVQLYTNQDMKPKTIDEMNAILRQNQKALDDWAFAVWTEQQTILVEIKKLEAVLQDQKKWEAGRTEIHVVMHNMDNGKYIVKMNDLIFEASFSEKDDGTHVMSPEIPPMNAILEPIYTITRLYDVNDNFYGSIAPEGFTFFAPGTTITVLSTYKIDHIVSANPGQVLGVYAYRNYDGYRQLTAVPSNYYEVTNDYVGSRAGPKSQYDDHPNANHSSKTSWFGPVCITLPRPLSLTSYLIDKSKANLKEYIEKRLENGFRAGHPSHVEFLDEWEDQLYVTFHSRVTSNPVGIIAWLILNFSSYSVDSTSFAIAAGYTGAYPMDFALFEKKNLFTLINEIAVQARCAVWVRNYIFYIRYISAEPTSVDTIDKDDIQFGTLQLSCTDTEDIITKYTAIFRPNYLPETEDNKIIVRNNIVKYGVQEEVVDYYAYSTHYSVKKSATFWIIRKSNTWKRITFKTPLHKLNLETMDCVTIDLDFIANQPVKGIIESAIYDSANNSIEMTIWLPVRLGEMEPYVFAWPGSASVQEVFPTPEDRQAGGSSNFIEYSPKNLRVQKESTKPDTLASGFNNKNKNNHKRIINSLGRPDTLGTQYPSDANDDFVVSNYIGDDANIGTEPRPEFDYHLRDVNIPPPSIPAGGSPKSSSFPGFIGSKVGDLTYNVNVYKDGLEGSAETIVARQLQLLPAEIIPPGTGVIVTAITIAATEESEESEETEAETLYYMQVPVWL